MILISSRAAISYSKDLSYIPTTCRNSCIEPFSNKTLAYAAPPLSGVNSIHNDLDLKNSASKQTIFSPSESTTDVLKLYDGVTKTALHENDRFNPPAKYTRLTAYPYIVNRLSPT